MVERRGGHVPVRKVRRPNVGEVHGEVGDDAVENALLFCVVRPEKEKVGKLCSESLIVT